MFPNCIFDDEGRADEHGKKTVPVYGTMRVGRDCQHIPAMIANLNTGIGHLLVVVSTDSLLWIDFSSTLEELHSRAASPSTCGRRS